MGSNAMKGDEALQNITTNANGSSKEISRAKIIVRQVPFNSLIASTLVGALDFEQGNDELSPDPRPQPNSDGTWPAAPTFTTRTDHDHDQEDSVFVSQTPDPVRNEDIYFFVAFAVVSHLQDETWIPAGGIGFRELPFFPSHHAPESTNHNDNTTSMSSTEPKTAELKRFYVMPEYRYVKEDSKLGHSLSFGTYSHVNPKIQSVAAALLHSAERFARDRLQVHRIVLETWAPLLPAIKFYGRNGYTRREDFGDWVEQGESAGGMSRCFEKMLV